MTDLNSLDMVGYFPVHVDPKSPPTPKPALNTLKGQGTAAKKKQGETKKNQKKAPQKRSHNEGSRPGSSEAQVQSSDPMPAAPRKSPEAQSPRSRGGAENPPPPAGGGLLGIRRGSSGNLRA